MGASGKKIYGVADRAWQVVVGCDPKMKCAPRCWARKTVARIVECQKGEHPERAGLFQIALAPGLRQWSGQVFIDDAHLTDPLRWKKAALIATGFHGDFGRLADEGKDKMFAVMAMCEQHRFMPLTKQPADVLAYFRNPGDLRDRWSSVLLDQRIWPGAWGDARRAVLGSPSRAGVAEGIWKGWRSLVLKNVSIGCSIMDQADADKHQPALAELAARGWATHVWHEPAIGPVNWKGWEFLRGVITGFESGSKSRPGHPNWARSDRDWCVANGIPFNFKQWGDWAQCGPMEVDEDFLGGTAFESASSGRVYGGAVIRERQRYRAMADGVIMERVGKKAAGRLLDGREWNEMPEVKAA